MVANTVRQQRNPRSPGFDIGVSGGRAVPIKACMQRVHAAAGRLAGLGAVLVGVLSTEGLDHYAVAMKP